MRTITIFLICAIIHGAAFAATCEPGYYPENGTCTICPMYYACPDGESKIFCRYGSGEYSGQYTDGPGATKCLDCPSTLLHSEGFIGYGNYRVANLGLISCRARWRRRTEHGEKIFSCEASADGYYDSAYVSDTKCMLDTSACDAGYVSILPKNEDGNYRTWFDSYPLADSFEVCGPVGIGYYSADGDLESTACPTGTSTRTDTAASADECLPLCTGGATKFHAGEHVFNVWREKYTSPTLKVELPSGVACHINLAPGEARGTINVSYNGQTYHVTN